MKEIIVAYQGEMTLKGLNRGTFEAVLAKSMKYRLKDLGNFKVYKAQSCMYAEPMDDNCDVDAAFDRISYICGFIRLSRSVVCDKYFDTICKTAEEYLGPTLRSCKTFKVEAKRSDKKFPMNSPEICREL